jgi:uncharacterized membrane protein YeaQ/YmgE (transglycosylase-associated protein family)
MSKPTWSNTFGCSATSAFVFALFQLANYFNWPTPPDSASTATQGSDDRLHKVSLESQTMIGIFSWLACGVAAGFFVSHLISGRDKGIVLLTLAVGVGGAVAGGLIASLFHYGDGATFSLYALPFTLIGAALALIGYRRMIGA